jgi:hypothetical protein
MAIEFVDHRFDTKKKKRVEEKITPKVKGAVYNLQGQPIPPEVRQQEQKIIQKVTEVKKGE